MNKNVLFAILMCFPLLGLADQEVERSIKAEQNGRVLVKNTSGRIAVQGWGKSEVQVKGVLDDNVKELIVETEKRTTRVEVVLKEEEHDNGGSTNLNILVPNASEVEIDGVATDLELTGIDGGIDVAVVSGNIIAQRIKNRMYVRLVSGDLQLKDSSGKLEVKLVNGDMQADVDSAQIKVSTVNGDIELKTQHAVDVSLKTVSGSIEFEGELDDKGDLQVGTISGDAEIRLVGDLNAYVTLKAGPGGDIDNKLTDQVPEEDSMGLHQKIQFTVGQGGAHVRVKTVSGDIEIGP